MNLAKTLVDTSGEKLTYYPDKHENPPEVETLSILFTIGGPTAASFSLNREHAAQLVVDLVRTFQLKEHAPASGMRKYKAPEEQVCANCTHLDIALWEAPCVSCDLTPSGGMSNFESGSVGDEPKGNTETSIKIGSLIQVAAGVGRLREGTTGIVVATADPPPITAEAGFLIDFGEGMVGHYYQNELSVLKSPS